MQRREFMQSAAGGAAGTGLLDGAIPDDASPGEIESVQRLSAPSGEVTIKTDEHNVSHVYADDFEAMSFGAGYVQARDRLFQLDALRHIGYGDSASILGPDQLGSDIQVTRDLPTEEEIRTQYEEAPEYVRKSLQAFADGVNRKMEEYDDENEMPAEFTYLLHDPDPWTPEDSVVVINYLIGIFGVGGGGELGNAGTLLEMAGSLGDLESAHEAYGDLNWLEVPDDHPTSIQPEDLTVDGGESVPEFGDVPTEQWRVTAAAADTEPWGIDRAECGFAEGLLTGCHDETKAKGVLEGYKFGSNGMVVGGEHTETGNPMMFGAPQMGYFKPPVIHEIGMHGAGFDVTGVSVAGAPGVIAGRTPDFAWSVTSGRDDQVDTIAVDLHPEDRYRYEWDGEYHEFETFTVTHNTTSVPELIEGISEGEWDVTTVKQEVARIRQDGEVMPVIAWNEEERVAYAQRKTTRGDELEGAFLWMNMGRQNDLSEFRDQLSEFPFTFNFLYADEDDIAMVHTCKVPERADGLDHRLPKPESLHEWDGFLVGRDAGLEVVNPSQGYVVNWNNAPAVGWRAGDGEQNWGSLHRVEVLDRGIRRKIAEGPVSLSDVRDVVRYAATHDANAHASAPEMVAAARDSADAKLQAMADELEAWGETDYAWADADDDDVYDHAGHAIWESTRKHLQSALFDDVLGSQTPHLEYDPPKSSDPHAGDHGRSSKDVTFVDALNGETTYDWFGGGEGSGGTLSTDGVTGRPGRAFTFDASVVVETEDVDATYEWSFGDGTTATGVEVTHTFEDPGTYEVTLTVETAAGATRTRTGSVHVFEGAPAVAGECRGDTRVTRLTGSLDDDRESAVHTHELGDACGLTVTLMSPDDADFDVYLTLDGREPSRRDYDYRAWTHGARESIHLPADPVEGVDEVAVKVLSYRGSGEYTLVFEAHGAGAGPSSSSTAARNRVIRAAMSAAATDLSNRFDSSDPADWTAEEHDSKFTAIGVIEADRIDMSNRGSWIQVVAPGQGLEGAMGVLPPANSGHITFLEKTGGFLGISDEPDRLTDQLDLYRNFEYKPLPVTPDEVEGVTNETRRIEPGEDDDSIWEEIGDAIDDLF